MPVAQQRLAAVDIGTEGEDSFGAGLDTPAGQNVTVLQNFYKIPNFSKRESSTYRQCKQQIDLLVEVLVLDTV